MTWYKDLENCDYFGTKAANSLLAVGWLERGHDFTSGNIDKEIYDRLCELFQDPFQPVISAGLHICDLCQFSEKFGGVHNLFVPNGETIFVCPELILHYIDAHWYKPPASFCEAVMVFGEYLVFG
jgi:hypothetical protein